MKYKIVCDEIGNPEYNPYASTNSKEEAFSICKQISKKYKSRVFVIENGNKIYMVDFSGYNKFKKGI